MTTDGAPETHIAPGPPVAERRPHKLVAHGDERVDDWYWVRDRTDPALMALLEAENAYTKAATAHLEGLTEQLYQEILSRIELTDVTYPAPKGPFAYYSRTVDGKQHDISCRRPRSAPAPKPGDVGEDPDETVVLDENVLAEGHDYLEVGDRALSPDHRLLAYAMDTSGGELMTVRVRDIESGTDLADVIEGAYYGLAFGADNETLFYTRPDDTLRPYQVWRHRLGTAPSRDVKVLEEADERFFLGVGTSKDGRLVVMQAESNITSEWHFVPASEPEAEPRLVAARRQGVLYSIEHHDGSLLILSNDGAENFSLFSAPLSSPGREHWTVLVPGRDDVRLEDLDVIAGYALLEERGHATTAVRLHPLGAGEERVIEAPEAGSVFLAQNLEFSTARVRYESSTLTEPPALRELDLETGRDEVLWRRPVPGYDPSAYRTERCWATSADGTRVPITLAWRGDRAPGPGPCLLYGYGAYGISSDPVFRVNPVLDHGVLFAIAHVRGGEELGRHWYLDGKLDKKPHSFEDFVAAARLLSEEGWTTPAQLAAHGGSAGGLLMGASVNLDPDAFGAIVAEVPFVDCLTTMLDPSLPLTTNEWEEWGDPVSSEQAYRTIKSYSPYDNVAERTYPKMLVTGGITDPRVGYFEPVKWVQKLRASVPSGAGDILLQMELSAGHFGPSGRYEAWKKRAFMLAFALGATGAGASQQPAQATG